MTVSDYLSILFALALVLLFVELRKVRSELQLTKKLFSEKPWLAQAIVLPSDCVPRRFGDHYMDDLILCVKRVGPNEKDVQASVGCRG